MENINLNWIDWATIVIYLVTLSCIGIWAGKKAKTAADYFMGSRRFGKLSMVAQGFSVGTHTDQVIAVAGASSQYGLSGIWYQWAYIFVNPFFWLIAPIYRRLRYATMADFFEHRYGRGMALLYSFAAIVLMTMNLGVVLKGTVVTIATLVGNDISPHIIMLVMVLLIVAYAFKGGFLSAVYSDILQGALILVLSFMLIPLGVDRAGGWETFLSLIPEGRHELTQNQHITLFFVVMVVLNSLVSVVALPHHMAIGAGRTELDCRIGWTYGTFVKRFATIGWVFIGITGVALFADQIGKHLDTAFGVTARELLPPGLVGLMLIGILSASLSTCDSFLVHGSAIITYNLLGVGRSDQAQGRQNLIVGRRYWLLILGFGVLFAYIIPDILTGIKESWKIMAYFGLAFWFGVIWKRANAYGALCSSLAMFITSLICQHVLEFSFPQQVAAYLTVGVVSFILVCLLTKPPFEAKLKDFYQLLDTPVGQEEQLRRSGVHILMPGFFDAQQERSHSSERLLIVDLLILRKAGFWCAYRTDIVGFATATGVTVFLLILLFIISRTLIQ